MAAGRAGLRMGCQGAGLWAAVGLGAAPFAACEDACGVAGLARVLDPWRALRGVPMLVDDGG